jgi:dihydropyrimidinase
MPTLIKGGIVVAGDAAPYRDREAIPRDVLIDGATIAAVGPDLPVPPGAEVVDAAGLYVLPGGIDVHTHLDLPVGATRAADDFYSGHKAAAFGGTTTHIDFATQDRGGSLAHALEVWHGMAQGKAVIDYGFHLAVVDVNDAVLDELAALPAAGVTSLKLYLAYKGVLQVDDGAFLRTLQRAAQHGLLTMVHAENGDAIAELQAQARAAGRLTPEWHARTRPAWAEAEATLRAIALAAMAEAPLYVVHMTCAGALDQLRYARARGLPVMGETCPQYLYCTADDLARPDFEGAKFVCSPPLRTPADQDALWQALQDGTLDVVSTDHCPFFFDGTRPIVYEGKPVQLPGKELGRDDFTRIPNGVPGIGDRLALLWSEGVATGHLSPERFVALTATNPARLFGLYPRKGVLAPGSDADVVLWDPRARHTLSVQTSHHRTDYCLYEGVQVTGKPVKVYRRGALLVDGDEWRGVAGEGRFVRRDAFGEGVSR